MVSGARQRAFVAAGVLAVGAGGAAVLAQSGNARNTKLAAGQHGLSAEGLLIDRAAAAGAKNTVKLRNGSDEALTVTVAARPWTQSSSGAVSPNRRSTLGGVTVSASEFTLAKGEERSVDVTLTSGAPLYGAVEVIGLPADIAKRKGVVAGYRLVGSLRYQPAAKTYKLTVSAPKVAKDMIVLPIRNTGNTNDAVSGSVQLKGPTGTRRGSVKATRVLPGKRINVALLSSKSLASGTYTATISVKQGTFKQTLKKTLRVKRG